jgi:hypothetical protein
MAQFMGWESYDLPRYCRHCDEFYEEEEEHEECDNNDSVNNDGGLCETESSP